MSAATVLQALTAEWSQLQDECEATGRAAECGDLLRPAVERVRALVREAPCPEGWSRLDYVFGPGEACDVPVLARDAGALLCAVSCFVAVVCCAYLLARLRAHGASRTSSKYSMYSSFLGANCFFLLHSGSALLLPPSSYDGTLGVAVFVTAVVFSFHAISVVLAAVLGNAAETIFSLQPARAAFWHGRYAMVGDVFWPICYCGILCGYVQLAAGSRAGDSALAHRGVAHDLARRLEPRVLVWH